MMMRRAWSVTSALIAAIAVMTEHGQTEEAFPDRPVHFIVPFAAGGGTDIAARVIAISLSEQWGRPVVVENKPGATGALAAEFVARSRPDGYTLLVGTGGVNAVLPAFKTDLPFDTLKDFVPISSFFTTPNVLVVHPSVPARTVAEFIALLKANPGKYEFASSGVGSAIHLTGELFKQATETDMVHVPYKGSAPAMNDLLGGHVKVMFDNLSSALPHIQAGRLRALGVTGTQRDQLTPDVPTVAETQPGFDVTVWVGLLGPRQTPSMVVSKLADGVRSTIGKPDIAARLRGFGGTPLVTTPEEFGRLVRVDVEKWRAVVQKSGIRSK